MLHEERRNGSLTIRAKRQKNPLQKHPDFEIETSAWLFSENELTKDVTY